MSLPISDGVMGRLDEFWAALGVHLWDSRQRASLAMYMLGLLSEQRHKSVESIASQFAADAYGADLVHQKLLHFLSVAPWPDEALRQTATRWALAEMTLQGPVQTLIIDDTSFAKSGSQSVGVQRQYCGSLGKVANCQVVVSLTAATARGHLPIDMQLYVPQKWLSSPELRHKAHIPEALAFQTKPELALSLLSRALLAGVPPGVVLADAAYGDNAGFREELTRLKLHYAVAIQLSTTVQLVRNEPETTSVQALLDRIKMRPFRRYAWRQGTTRELTARFAFFAVRIPKSDSEKTLWLILERRDGSSSTVRAYLSNLPRNTPRKKLVYLLKERWRTEATYRDSKQELGLGQYQGRLYPGLQHHLSSVLCTCAFVASERARFVAQNGPAAPKMERTPENLQRHSPTSIATLRHLIALAVSPWLHTWFRHPPATPPHLREHPQPTHLAGWAGG